MPAWLRCPVSLYLNKLYYFVILKNVFLFLSLIKILRVYNTIQILSCLYMTCASCYICFFGNSQLESCSTSDFVNQQWGNGSKLINRHNDSINCDSHKSLSNIFVIQWCVCHEVNVSRIFKDCTFSNLI